MTDVIVGSGPNGLACAATLAKAGRSVTVIEAEATIGGGTRTSELTLPGLLHDDCSATHPMSPGSPALLNLDLENHGLKWLWPEVDLAHPLDDGSAGILLRSIEETADGLGDDGQRWKQIFGKPSADFDALGEDIMKPILHQPRHPLKLMRFGVPAAAPANLFARAFSTPQAKALFGGVAAHAFSPLTLPMSSSVGMALICACHRHGWPVAQGGSQSIADALAAVVLTNGGRIETGRRVKSLDELADADTVILDLDPAAAADVIGDRLPTGVDRAYRRYRHGPAAFKVDLAVEGGIPWTNEACRKAGTVHAIGTFSEIVLAEGEVHKGRMPQSPYVIVGQQSLADPTRAKDGVHPIWAYAHVPKGYDGNATEDVIGQIERFAPGFRDRILGKFIRDVSAMETYNSNYVGGDIINGANTPWQTVIRPRLALDPYSTGVDGVFICSAATPPGAGAHGMNGYNAARSVLRNSTN
ncbi:MAG: NAD(P)/FAD-dependent oxidoreductase [Thermoleophilia bacterium]|nr:NAD(P)/FAD-dependent oxidoreductase [Thermoleophilia bacterium]